MDLQSSLREAAEVSGARKTLLWLALAVIGSVPCHAQSYQVEGILTKHRYQIPAEMPGLAKEERYQFRSVSDPTNWNVQILPIDVPGYPLKYIEAGCDGQTLYIYEEQDVEQGRLAAKRKGLVLATWGIARIIPDTVPHPEFVFAPLWLAYCSSGYFRTNASGRARQFWLSPEIIPGPVLTNRLVKANWSWLPGGEWFLARGEFFRSEGGGRESVTEADAKPHLLYDVRQTRDIGGAKLPLEFELTSFQEPEKIRPFGGYSALATNVRASGPLTDPRPRIKVPVTMMDFRFRKDFPAVPLFQHRVTNGVWPEKLAAAATKEFQMAKRVALTAGETPTQVSGKRPTAFMIAFLVANAALFGVWFGKRTKQTNAT